MSQDRTHILILEDHDEEQEIEFELRWLLSLTVEERFQLMVKRTEELLNLWRIVDTEDLLKLLKEHRVDFVIIGASAFRNTQCRLIFIPLSRGLILSVFGK